MDKWKQNFSPFRAEILAFWLNGKCNIVTQWARSLQLRLKMGEELTACWGHTGAGR
jgi:hypothetical protein